MRRFLESIMMTVAMIASGSAMAVVLNCDAVRTVDGTEVAIEIEVPEGTMVWGYEEYLPEGLAHDPASLVGPNPAWDQINRKISWWGTGAGQVILGYSADGDPGEYELQGIVNFDGSDGTVCGDNFLNIAGPPDPVDEEFEITLVANPPDGGVVEGGGIYVEDTMVEVTAEANVGFIFNNWTEDDQIVSVDPVYNFVAVADRSLVANFTPVVEPGDGTSTRTITDLDVVVAIVPSADTSAWGCEEYLPEGLTPNNITGPNANWNEADRIISWFDTSDQPADLTYSVSGDPGIYTIDGSASFDGQDVATEGDQLVEIEVPQYTITVAAQPLAGGVVNGGGEYEDGQPATVTAIANDGFIFHSWTENGQEVATSAEYNFTVTEDRDLVANFSAITQVAAPVFDPAGGTFAGETVQVVVTCETEDAAIHYTTDNSEPTENSPVVASGEAVVVPLPGILKARAFKPGMNPSPVTTGEYQAEIAPGDRINVALAINGGVAKPGLGAIGASLSRSNPASQAIDNNINTAWCMQWRIPTWLEVQFDDLYTIDQVGVVWGLGAHFNTFSIQLSTDGQNWHTVVSSRTNDVDAGYDGYRYQGNTQVKQDQFNIPATLARFIRINLEDSSAPITHACKALVHELQAFADVEVEPPATVDITVTAEPPQGGIVDGGGTYDQGTEVTVSAEAAQGYQFDHWSEQGDLVSDQADYTFQAEADRDLIASFSELPDETRTINLIANPEAGGSVGGDGVYAVDTEATVTAVANPGYIFVNWTEEGVEVSTDSEYSFTVADDRNLVANFTELPTVATPTFTPDAGSYPGPTVEVVVDCATENATIHYTLDGSTPDQNSDTVIAGQSLIVTIPATLKARAYKQDMAPSPIKSADYVADDPQGYHNIALAANGGVATPGLGAIGASLSRNNPAGNAIDGDPATYWCMQWRLPSWLEVRFDGLYTIRKVGVVWGDQASRQTFSIELSTDGINWTTVVAERESDLEAGAEQFMVDPTLARYIRINILDSDAPITRPCKASLQELQAFVETDQ